MEVLLFIFLPVAIPYLLHFQAKLRFSHSSTALHDILFTLQSKINTIACMPGLDRPYSPQVNGMDS